MLILMTLILNNYDRKNILTNDNDNPNKGTQTDVFNETPSITESESIKTPEKKLNKYKQMKSRKS